MIRGLFITGTDTGVGKTVVTAALMHRYRKELPLRYWKPIQTGVQQDDDTATVRVLGACAENEILDEGVRLKQPVSPHLAAKLSGEQIEIESLFKILAAKTSPKVSWIIEGAGGVLVPINKSAKMIDLMRALSLPVLVVASARLGTINHTLLTLEALRRRALVVAGVVMVGEQQADNSNAIESYGAISVLAEMPWFPQLSSSIIRNWAPGRLDPANLLLDHLKCSHSPLQYFKP